MTLTDEMTWHKDGHAIHLQLNKSEIRIVGIDCPHKDAESAPCKHPDAKCAVIYFVSRYGLECNVGVCEPQPKLDIAWTMVGGSHNEIDACQIWFIPESDEAFAAWIITQQAPEQ